jgi:hypothetical protein
MRSVLLALLSLIAGGCATAAKTDYTAFIDHMPRSILILPPLDET